MSTYESSGKSQQGIGQGGSDGGSSSGAGSTGMANVAKDAQETLKETAQETIDTAKQTVQELTTQTQEQVGEVVSQTAQQATQAVSEIKEQATTTFFAQRDRAVEMLNALASALKTTSQNLADEAKSGAQEQSAVATLGPLVDDVADRIAHSAEFLREKDMSGLMREAQTLARKQPVLFLGAMFGIGVAGARMFKGMNESGDSSSTPSESGSSFPPYGMENDQANAMSPMAQSAYDGIENAATRGSASISSYDDLTNKPGAMSGIDEMPAGTGSTGARPTERRS
jgi:hypothetical protein